MIAESLLGACTRSIHASASTSLELPAYAEAPDDERHPQQRRRSVPALTRGVGDGPCSRSVKVYRSWRRRSRGASVADMPDYMIVRSFDCGEADMPEVGTRSRQLIEEKYQEVIWRHSHVVVDDEGNVRTYCVYQAPDEDTVRAHSRDLGRHGIDSIEEIAGDVTPADFPVA